MKPCLEQRHDRMFIKGKFHVYSMKILKLHISPSKSQNIIFVLLNFKNSKIYLFYYFSIKTNFKFTKYSFILLLLKKIRSMFKKNIYLIIGRFLRSNSLFHYF